MGHLHAVSGKWIRKKHEAARIVTGANKLVSIEKLLSEVGWETVSCRKKHNLIQLYKMRNGLCSEYLSSLVPPTVGNKYSL